jgi:hypothetical protein
MKGYIMDSKFLNLQSGLVCSYNSIESHDQVQSTNAGVRILYLPPYSPNLNPVEEAISKIKLGFDATEISTLQIIGFSTMSSSQWMLSPQRMPYHIFIMLGITD